MSFMPFPSVFDYRSDIAELRPPCRCLPEFFRRGDKDGRVSGTAQRFFNRKVTAGPFFSQRRVLKALGAVIVGVNAY